MIYCLSSGSLSTKRYAGPCLGAQTHGQRKYVVSLPGASSNLLTHSSHPSVTGSCQLLQLMNIVMRSQEINLVMLFFCMTLLSHKSLQLPRQPDRLLYLVSFAALTAFGLALVRSKSPICSYNFTAAKNKRRMCVGWTSSIQVQRPRYVDPVQVMCAIST